MTMDNLHLKEKLFQQEENHKAERLALETALQSKKLRFQSLQDAFESEKSRFSHELRKVGKHEITSAALEHINDMLRA